MISRNMINESAPPILGRGSTFVISVIYCLHLTLAQLFDDNQPICILQLLQQFIVVATLWKL